MKEDRLIISLGDNCEVSSRLQFCYGKIPVYPFSWVKILNYNKFIECLNNDFANLFTGDISLTSPGMLCFSKYEIAFHVQDRKGILIKEFDSFPSEDDLLFYKEQLISKWKHLIDKFNNLKDKKVCFIELISGKPLDNYYIDLYNALSRYSDDFEIHFVTTLDIKDKNINSGIFFHHIHKISNNAGNPYGGGLDRFRWLFIFNRIKHIKLIRYLIKTSGIYNWFNKYYYK